MTVTAIKLRLQLTTNSKFISKHTNKCYLHPLWCIGALRWLTAASFSSKFCKTLSRVAWNDVPAGDGLSTKYFLKFKMGLTELRFFFPFPALEWLQLLLGRPPSWLSCNYLTFPTSTMFEIRTPVRGAPSATKVDARLSMSNQNTQIFLEDLRHNPTFSRRALK